MSSSEDLIIVIGRGHSGTRVISHTLYASGVFMGNLLNAQGDTVPAKPMYEAARLVSAGVRWRGGLSWDFSQLQAEPVDRGFEKLVTGYLERVLAWPKPHRGWKLSETTLAYPWIVRMFPRAKFVQIVRDPRDALLTAHATDDLTEFNVSLPALYNKFDHRVASWKYQREIVKATPRPEHLITVRYEDIVRDQEAALHELEGFLGIPLGRIVIDKTRVGQWKRNREILDHLEPLAEDMRELGYS